MKGKLDKNCDKQRVDKMNSNSFKSEKNDINEQIVSMFPQKPYDTQFEIAKCLYSILNNKKSKVVIVESPTGTGKTYALLVGVLAWLKNNRHELQQNVENKQKEMKGDRKQKQETSEQSNSFPSWLNSKAAESKLKKILAQHAQKVQKLKSIKQVKQQKLKQRVISKKQEKTNEKGQQKIEWEIQDIEDIEDYNCVKGGVKRNYGNKNNFVDGFGQFDEGGLPKIIFVSRTHSQLGQVMDSVGKINFDEIRYVSMASKDHLCVHPAIQKNKVHQKCQYLLTHGGCPYYHQQPISDFIGLKIQQSQALGQSNSLCSYYSIKHLVPISDLICIPYSSILNPQIRSKLGISLINSIIIFDEAHNIIEQQLSIKSPEIYYHQLLMLQQRIIQYCSKYGAKMSQSNLGLVRHIQAVVAALADVIKLENAVYRTAMKEGHQDVCSYTKMTKIQLYRKLKLAQIKVYRIKTYISLSNFDQKLCHFLPNKPFPVSILNNFLDFLTILTSAQQHTQSTVVLIKNSSPTNADNSNKQQQVAASIKIFCMESTELAVIAHQSRLVILAGGTMQPISSYARIFKQNRLSFEIVRGKHVIKEDQCNVWCISGRKISGKRQKDKRKSEKNVDENVDNFKIMFTFNELKQRQQQIMKNTCSIIKDIVLNKTAMKSGTVVFIQNYNLIDKFYHHIGPQIQGIPVFYDTNQNSKELDDQIFSKNMNAFDKYQKMIKQNKCSAVLVSVMGGRLSEGINFSDELARSIIVIGLPYPNIKSAQIVEKMHYLDSRLNVNIQKPKQLLFESAKAKYRKQKQEVERESEQRLELELESGRNYYQNCCIRTINQTIGRGIRHINDYANIYLIDARFAGISHRLPNWMQSRIQFVDFYQC